MTNTTTSAPELARDTDQLSFDPSDPDPHIGPCPPWCRQAETGHRVAVGPDERKHVGVYARIALALMDMHITRLPSGLTIEPQTIEAQLERRDRDAEPIVVVTIDTERDIKLTLDEARTLRDAITTFLVATGLEAADR